VSLWLAFAAFVLAVVAIAVLVSAPKPARTQTWEIINVIAILVLFGFAPVGHVIGTAFGFAALIRPNDRRGLGIAGLLVNAAALVAAVGLVVLVFRGLGSFS
jgi:hypothetical protein